MGFRREHKPYARRVPDVGRVQACVVCGHPWPCPETVLQHDDYQQKRALQPGTGSRSIRIRTLENGLHEVVDAETGVRIEGVTRVEIIIENNGLATAKLTFESVEVDLEADVEATASLPGTSHHPAIEAGLILRGMDGVDYSTHETMAEQTAANRERARRAAEGHV